MILGRQAREPGVSGTTYWIGRESGRRCDGPNEGPDCCALCVVPEADSVQIGSSGSLPSNNVVRGAALGPRTSPPTGSQTIGDKP